MQETRNSIVYIKGAEKGKQMKSKQFGKRDRQEGAMKRTEAQIKVYEQELVNDKSNKDLKKKIERAKSTIENTKKNLK